MKYLSLILLALVTSTAGATPHTTTDTFATEVAQILTTDDRAEHIEPGMKPLAGIPGSVSAGNGLQSIPATPARRY